MSQSGPWQGERRGGLAHSSFPLVQAYEELTSYISTWLLFSPWWALGKLETRFCNVALHPRPTVRDNTARVRASA